VGMNSGSFTSPMLTAVYEQRVWRTSQLEVLPPVDLWAVRPVRTIKVGVLKDFTCSCLRGPLLLVGLRAVHAVRAAEVVDLAEFAASCSWGSCHK
jgi:hypothetical protein